MALMSDPGASPVRARAVRLEGKAIGRVNPGFIAGEDFIFQDWTGLIAVDFRSMLGLIGNLFAGYTRVPKHFDQPGNVTGWFRRGMGGSVILRELTHDRQVAQSAAAVLANPVVPSRHWRDRGPSTGWPLIE